MKKGIIFVLFMALMMAFSAPAMAQHRDRSCNGYNGNHENYRDRKYHGKRDGYYGNRSHGDHNNYHREYYGNHRFYPRHHNYFRVYYRDHGYYPGYCNICCSYYNIYNMSWCNLIKLSILEAIDGVNVIIMPHPHCH